ncbi:hypothetical protein L211DRAFT_850180 [Terfezia boudieri ATCC MYA-4762]|uniref:Uncharacterized protein n=1 Tax=Terfezia boudieri ATCC MYA-4762 TaxID=1051890 RepID=A0A3N4LJU5_9PEZI|nr:hypothetical protein L211DRAFT_850180 [Terfezia boudieri ATCC MYA-4762]
MDDSKLQGNPYQVSPFLSLHCSLTSKNHLSMGQRSALGPFPPSPMMPRTRSKGSVQVGQPPLNPHEGKRVYDIITVKPVDTTPSTGSVLPSPHIRGTTGQTSRNSAIVANGGGAEQVADARPGGENKGAKSNNIEIPSTIPCFSNSQDIKKMSDVVPSPTLTKGGRPQRQAAIAGAARIKEAHQEPQDESDEAHEDYSPPANETEAEGTIICSTETAELGAAKAKLVRKGVAQPAPENDNKNDELITSPEKIDELDETDGIDDDNDEDFEVDREETEDEDDGVMDGDEGISEIEEMGRKEKKRTIARKKGPSRERKPGKTSMNILLKKNAPPARGVVGFRVTKVSQKYTREGEVNFSPDLLQSMLPPQFRQDSQAPPQSNTIQGLPDMPLLPMGTSNGIQEGQMMPFHTISDESAGYLPRWEISGNLPHSEYPTYPGLIQIGSEDDEAQRKLMWSQTQPLFSGSTKRHSATQALEPKSKKPRSAPRKPRTNNSTTSGVFGGPSETKFRRREIAAMLQVITKDIKWKDVQRAVGNERRTPGSYASHWKNVLMKNILERYQE